MGRPLSPPQIHRKNIECQANPTKQLLNAGRGHQAPRKAFMSERPSLSSKEVGQNINYKKRDKRGRDRDPSQEGSLKKEVSKHQETLSL